MVTFDVLVSAVTLVYVLTSEYVELRASDERENETFVFLSLDYFNVMFSNSIY